MDLAKRLLFPQLTVTDHHELFALAAAPLFELGYVKDSWLDALVIREKTFPTGVAVTGGGVALPHTDASHVNSDALAVATLTTPVPFAPMGGGDGDEAVSVTTVLFLVVSDPTRHMQSLSRTVKAIQTPAFLQELHSAQTPEHLQEVVSTHLAQ
jgi:PTS system galactitol-specific IIA component